MYSFFDVREIKWTSITYIKVIVPATLMILPEERLWVWHERHTDTVKASVRFTVLPQTTCQTQE